jgi:hypothetical protein
MALIYINFSRSQFARIKRQCKRRQRRKKKFTVRDYEGFIDATDFAF